MPSEAQVEINTELARKLQESIDNGKKRKFKPSPALKKHLKAKEKGAAAPEHVDANDKPQAVLRKNSSYRENGTKYLRAQDGRGVYRNFSHKHLKKIREVARQAAEFPEGPVQNFDRRALGSLGRNSGAKWPYVWEAHHMIPGDVFTHMKAGGKVNGAPVFTPQQYRLLCKSDYNVNDGHNIIMLPDQNWAVPIHVLLQHPSDHPEYTVLVMTKCQDISQALQRDVDKNKGKHKKDLKTAIAEELRGLEEDLWDFLVALSQDVVNAVIEGQEFDEGQPVRFSKKDGTPYKWGALY